MLPRIGGTTEGFRRKTMEKIIVRANEAAKMLATSPNRIMELLESGQLQAYRDGRNWSIPISAVVEYAESRAAKEAAERRKKWIVG